MRMKAPQERGEKMSELLVTKEEIHYMNSVGVNSQFKDHLDYMQNYRMHAPEKFERITIGD